MASFSSRISELEPEGAYTVLAQAQELEKQGRKILHLEIGQPDHPTPNFISQAGMQAIQDGYTRYNPTAGLSKLRELLAESAGLQRGIQISPARVMIGPGAKPGLFFSTLALIEAGDEVIYPDPGFPTYAAMIKIAGGIPVPIPLIEENQFSFDLEHFESKLSKHTKLVIINSPSNPTGGVIPIEDLEFIAEKAISYGFWVLSDEIYSRLTYGDSPASSIASLPGMVDRTIIIDGFSKTYSMTGWRLGYAIMPEELARGVELLLVHSVGCTATFTQMAGIAALQGEQSFIDEYRTEYQARRDLLVGGLNSIPGVQCQMPNGAFYAFPNVKSFNNSSREISSRLLDEAGVALLAGSDFGQGGEGYLRLCYATSRNVISETIEKMKNYFANNQH
jgi:aspartate/methionine/tyrosine aminotransferase